MGVLGDRRSREGARRLINPPTVPISVTSFEVEWFYGGCYFDYLTVNGIRYCRTSPEGVVPDGTPIEWVTDFSETRAGSQCLRFLCRQFRCYFLFDVCYLRARVVSSK